VENAIEIAFRTVEENPGKNIYLLSEMIHNPHVNADLLERGIRFLQDTKGKQLIPFDDIRAEDIVLIPAFGTTLEIEKMLRERGIATEKYDTTCPFVEKVWNRSESIAKRNYTIVIHGKPQHEETRATFSHAHAHGPAVVVRDMREARELAKVMRGERTPEEFYTLFKGQYSPGFNVQKDLQRIGVVNQTTMLASDTQGIADFLRNTLMEMHGVENIGEHFADTRDTLCYATNDNQSAVIGMLQTPADLAIVVGGYNSSNTSHLVELCEEKLPTFFVSDEKKILSKELISHFNLHRHEETTTASWLPAKNPVSILLTSGASCPDALVEAVMGRLVELFPGAITMEEMEKRFLN
jgi:4-hydroxy-3-methylbut-2-enyl diphosphate reductase